MEVNEYFTFLQKIDKKKPQLHYVDLEDTENNELQEVKKVLEISTELVKIFKANAYLILYNLIEASFKEALWQVLETIHENGLDYTTVSDKIRDVWHSQQAWHYRDTSKDKFINMIKHTADSVLNNNIKFNRSFITKKQFSGNIDTKTIIDLSNQYGFDLPQINGQKKSNIDIVKTKRNDLAHGNLTFIECGRDYSIEELVKIKEVIIEFMTEILQNITQFVADKRYKKPPMIN
jgi:hypothetical protein